MKRRLFLLIMLMGLILTPVYGDREITLDTVYDGSIEEGTPFVRDDSSGYMLAYYLVDEDRMFIEWNISTIPDTAIIDDVDLRYYHHQGSGDAAGIYAMGLQPSVHPDTDAGNTDLYIDAKNGTKYGETTGQSSSWTWYTKDLGANADAYLEANLTNDWWAVGVESTPDSVYWGTEDNSTAAQLIVTYHLPSDPLYVVSNPVYENNTDAGTVTVSVTTPSNSTDESISADTDLYTKEEATAFSWDIEGGFTRYIHSVGPENFTVTLPEDTFYVYSFTLKDHTGKTGEGPSYLEAYRTIGGSETLIERMPYYVGNTIPLNLVYGRTYRLRVLFADGTRYDWGYFVAGGVDEINLILKAVTFTDQAQILYNHIHVEATRNAAGNIITLNYLDDLENTDWANVTISVRGGGVAYQASRNNDTYALNWAGANTTLNYIVLMNGEHGDYGVWGRSFILDASFTYPDPPLLQGIFGDVDADLIPFTICMVSLLTFSVALHERGLMATMFIASILKLINWATWSNNLLVFGWVLSIGVALVARGGSR